MAIPKYQRPAKVGNAWPGLTFNDLPGHPTKIEYPWKYHCPAPLCYMVIHASSEKIIDERIRKHQCPWFGGGTTTFSWGVMSDNYLAPIWERLDAEVDIIKGTTGKPTGSESYAQNDIQAARHRARAYAETLAILMPPFFSTANEIVNEAIVRWQNRQDGGDYETPGIGRLRYKTPQHTRSGEVIEEYDPAAPKKGPANKLTPDEIASIKKSTGFPVAMLAQAYNTTEEVVRYFQSQDN